MKHTQEYYWLQEKVLAEKNDLIKKQQELIKAQKEMIDLLKLVKP